MKIQVLQLLNHLKKGKTIRTAVWLFQMVLCILTAKAQTGSIKGNIRDFGTDKPLAGVQVVVDFTSAKATTNMYGDFSIGGVPVGDQTLTFFYPRYKTKKYTGVKVSPHSSVRLKIYMKEELNKMGEMTVTADRYQETEAAVISEIKNTDLIATGVSYEALNRTQDPNAAHSVKRMSGTLISEDKFVMIRGLNERYSLFLMNDVMVPATETDSRAFAFDMIPSSLIDRIMIYKTGGAELPADYAGGIISLKTKDIPDTNRLYAGLGFGYRAGTTTREILHYRGGERDFIGMDDGTRALPDGFPSFVFGIRDPQRTREFGEKSRIPIPWELVNTRAYPDLKFNIGYGGKFNLGQMLIGNITHAEFQGSNLLFEADRLRFRNRNDRNGQDTVFKTREYQFDYETRLGVIHNWAFVPSVQHKIEFKNFLNHSSRNSTTLRRELYFGGDKVPVQEFDSYNYFFEERLMYLGQLVGTHYLGANSKLNWAAAYGLSSRNEPNTRRLRTVGLPYDARPKANVFDTLPNYRSASHFFSKMNEVTLTLKADYEQTLNPLADEEKQIKLKVGGYLENKTRNFDARWMSYRISPDPRARSRVRTEVIGGLFREDNINDTTGLVLQEGTGPTDKYTASNTLTAGYASVLWPVTYRLSINGGARIEANTQNIESGTIKNTSPLVSFLPSVHATYKLSDITFFKLAYNTSVIRPALGELAPFRNYDFWWECFRVGNPNLQTTTIQHFDARFEFFPSLQDMITVGVFHKMFNNPIEQFMDTGQYVPNFVFKNSAAAQNTGLEIEVKKSLADLTLEPVLRDISFSGNFSYIFNSRITLTEEQRLAGYDGNRGMLGQSPYMANFGAYYISQKNQVQINLVYNVFGPRVFAAGNSIHNTYYEMPRHTFDMNITKVIGKHLEGRLSILDLFNMPVRVVQDNAGNGNPDYNQGIVLNFRRGQLATATFVYRF